MWHSNTKLKNQPKQTRNIPGEMRILSYDKAINSSRRNSKCDTRNRASKHMQQKWTELKGEINKSMVLVGEFAIAHSVVVWG